MIDLRQTPEYVRYMQVIGWSVARFQLPDSSCQIFIKKLPLLGNIAKLQRPRGKLDLRQFDGFAKEHALAALYIEPPFNTQLKIQDIRYKIHKSSFLPSKTIQIDLTQSEKELFNKLKKDTRYSLRKAEEAKVEVIESKDIETFIKFWQRSARSRGMWLPQKREILALWNVFGQKAHILFAHKNRPIHDTRYTIHDTPVAGILLVRSPNIAYYMYAFSTKEGNSLSAPTLLVWEAIKLAKNPLAGGGSKVFDFEGIYDERYPQTKNWKGFTRFKEGFGGKTVTYPQTLVRYYNPIVKFLI